MSELLPIRRRRHRERSDKILTERDGTPEATSSRYLVALRQRRG
ncbi:hypothetical protein [Rhodococcus sp. 1168]|nr:hypothetical protein [Rhodococcus sp. 1168]